jgi:hypothetical protein
MVLALAQLPRRLDLLPAELDQAVVTVEPTTRTSG